MHEGSITNLHVFDDPSEDAPDSRIRFPCLLVIVIVGSTRTTRGSMKFAAGGGVDVRMRVWGEDGLEIIDEYVANKSGGRLANLWGRQYVWSGIFFIMEWGAEYRKLHTKSDISHGLVRPRREIETVMFRCDRKRREVKYDVSEHIIVQSFSRVSNEVSQCGYSGLYILSPGIKGSKGVRIISKRLKLLIFGWNSQRLEDILEIIHGRR